MTDPVLEYLRECMYLLWLDEEEERRYQACKATMTEKVTAYRRAAHLGALAFEPGTCYNIYKDGVFVGTQKGISP